MKVCCIIYHSNISKKYKKQWIIEFVKSIYEQTYTNFDILECCYDNSNMSLFKNIFEDKKYIFINKKFSNNFQCQNYIFEKIFKKLDYDVCINTNIDDIYDKTRFEKQMNKIKEGCDLVTSNYTIFQEYDNNKYERNIDILNGKKLENDYDKRLFFTKLVLEKKVNYPFSSTLFTKKCWNESNKKIEYPENLYLSKSILKNKIKIDICTDFLLKHRIHHNQYSNIYKDKII